MKVRFPLYTKSDFIAPSTFDVQIVEQNWNRMSPIAAPGTVCVGSTTNSDSIQYVPTSWHGPGLQWNPPTTYAEEWERRLDESMAKMEEKNMRGLYEVFIVDPDEGAIRNRDCVVASSEESARIKVILASRLAKDIDEYDIIVRKVGCIRAKKGT